VTEQAFLPSVACRREVPNSSLGPSAFDGMEGGPKSVWERAPAHDQEQRSGKMMDGLTNLLWLRTVRTDHGVIDDLMMRDPDAFQLLVFLQRNHWGRDFGLANEPQSSCR
jgi:hypothetical protein